LGHNFRPRYARKIQAQLYLAAYQSNEQCTESSHGDQVKMQDELQVTLVHEKWKCWIALSWKSQPNQTIQMAYCKRFD